MTDRATNVHKCLCDGYIDALFRRIFLSCLGTNPGKPGFQTAAPLQTSMTGGRILSRNRAYQSRTVQLYLRLHKEKQPDQAPAGKFFSLSHFPWPVQSVSICGVSTKLKVNSGRTNPPVSLPNGSLHRTSGIDHLDGFQVNLAPTQPLNRKQRVLLRLPTLLEPTCKLIRIFTPGPEPLPLMCCLPS